MSTACATSWNCAAARVSANSIMYRQPTSAGCATAACIENELDLGQQNGNVYEVSKLKAEKLLRAADFLEQLTVYRPASVVGDSHTGYTTSSHGFYLPLQLAFLTADKVPPQLMGERFLKLLGLRGDEGKNLVPVDWLSAAIVHFVTHPALHGTTYHLTHPQPVTVSLIQRVVQEAIETCSTRRFVGTPTEEELAAYEELFLQMMEVYRSHSRDDPTFDRTNTDRALPHLPCPELDHESMLRVASYPVRHNFVLKRSEPVDIAFATDAHLRGLLATNLAATSPAAAGSADNHVGLEVSGSGGGQWRLTLRNRRLVGVELGLGASEEPRLYLSSKTLAALESGRLSVADALRSGRVVVECDDRAGQGSVPDVAALLDEISGHGRTDGLLAEAGQSS